MQGLKADLTNPHSEESSGAPRSTLEPRVNSVVSNAVILRALEQDFHLKSNIKLEARAIATQITPGSISESPEPVFEEENSLLKELKEEKYQVSFFRRFFTWLKEIFCQSYDRNTDLAKMAFEKIENRDELLKTAFDFIALQENIESVKENVTNLLKFCQKANFEQILNGFCAISDPTGKLRVFDELVKKHDLSNFDLTGLSTEQTEKLVNALFAADGAEHLADLVIKGKVSVDKFSELTDAQALQLAKALFDKGGADYLADLVIKGKVSVENFPTLDGISADKVSAFVNALLEKGGAVKLADLVLADKLKLTAEQALQLAKALLEKGCADSLADLVIKGKLLVDNFSELTADQTEKLANALFKTEGGAEHLAALVKYDKLLVGENQALQLAQALLDKGGEDYLAELVKYDKLLVDKFSELTD
ncbi:MAG: hypothetical protein LBD34_02595, partial [Puniceicoccales bacterium]|nr:hypothetical protein [Puniceicoccales bacterium]